MPRATAPDDLRAATTAYERWLGTQCQLVRADVTYKHERMASSPLGLLRGSYYRWAQLWPALCPDVASAPEVLAVADLHTENFGTWRDVEGRLIWGVNDFDEAYPLAYTNDLVRLAASVRLEIVAGLIRVPARAACAALLAGYSSAIESGGRPFVLDHRHPTLRAEAAAGQRDPERFWGELDALPVLRNPPRAAVQLLRHALPAGAAARLSRRRAGVGSLGHPRIVAVADAGGGRTAREAKALVPAAAGWAAGTGQARVLYAEIEARAVRCRDPFLETRGRWVVRRLAPDCNRLNTTSSRRPADQRELLHAMGAETANIHLGSSRAAIAAVRRDVGRRSAVWLHDAATTMAAATLADFREWVRRPSRA